MKRAKLEQGSNSMDRISDLPKDILQRILFFLSQKAAVRTSVLSKSWRHNWCTRPNLDLSNKNSKVNSKEFLSTVDKILKLYFDDESLCLEKFDLCISLVRKEYSDHEWVSLLKQWIPLLTTIGVKEFRLSIHAGHSIVGYTELPLVVFEAESLNFLHLYQCSLGQEIPENIPFIRLQELRLSHVSIQEEIFYKITSRCPLLTIMWFKYCTGLKTIKLEKKLHKYLKHFTYLSPRVPPPDECSIEVDVPTLETIDVMFCNIRFHVLEFSNLLTLSLDRVKILSDSVKQSQLCIGAPNIKYFNFFGSCIPPIISAPTSMLSNLRLHTRAVVDAQSWFLRLSQLLQALRHSKIIINIFHLSSDNMHIQQESLVQDLINGGNKPVVIENVQLRFAHVPSLVSFLNGLFCICRPRNIEPSFSSLPGVRDKEREKKELSELFCMIQKTRETENQEIWHDLEDLSIQSFDSSRQQWEPLQVTKLSESALLPDFDLIRFRLKWRED